MQKKEFNFDILTLAFFILAISMSIVFFREFNKEVPTKEELELQKQGYIKTTLTEEELASSNYQECIEYNNTFYCY